MYCSYFRRELERERDPFRRGLLEIQIREVEDKKQELKQLEAIQLMREESEMEIEEPLVPIEAAPATENLPDDFENDSEDLPTEPIETAEAVKKVVVFYKKNPSASYCKHVFSVLSIYVRDLEWVEEVKSLTKQAFEDLVPVMHFPVGQRGNDLVACHCNGVLVEPRTSKMAAESQSTKCQEMQLRHGLTAKSTWVLELHFTLDVTKERAMKVLANSSELDMLHPRNALMECQSFSCLNKITTPMCQ